MLQIQHIRKEYKTGKLVQKALDDVSLNLRDNEFVAQTPSRNFSLPVAHVLGSLSQWRDRNGLTPFSLSMLIATYILNVTQMPF